MIMATASSKRSLGPAMLALNERQRAFVAAFIELGGKSATMAARCAGYLFASEQSLRVQAHKLAHDPKIIAAIEEEAARRLAGGIALATTALIKIASDPKHKDQFRACVELLNRAGMILEKRQPANRAVVVEDQRSEAEVKERIRL